MGTPDLSEIILSFYLVEVVPDHLDFLSKVNTHPRLYGGSILRKAITRYVKQWLPLVAEHEDEILVAPLDIQWVWHCHMLSPLLYYEDCINITGKFINHKIHNKPTAEQLRVFAEKYWKEKYPVDSFTVNLNNGVDDEDSIDESETRLSKILGLKYDLEKAAARQKSFYYQVSLPHYRDKKFLERALERYKKFLYLKQQNPRTFLVPCYDMDLLWHIHQCFPIVYRHETEIFLGAVLNHDDSVNDRNEGSKLNVSDLNTRTLWKATFNEHFSAYGAMYRGEPHLNLLYKMTKSDTFTVSTKSTYIKFDRIEIIGLSTSVKVKMHIIEKEKFVLSHIGNKNETFDMSEKVLTLKGSKHIWDSPGTIQKRFHTIDSDNLAIQLRRTNTLLCCAGGGGRLGEHDLKIEPLISKFNAVNHALSETIIIDLEDEVQVVIDMTLTPTKLTDCPLWLEAGQYEDCVMPENIQQMWGPVPLPRLPPGVDNKCIVASHRLLNFKGKVTFTCRVIHSLPLMMSAVHVFYHDKMAAVAHLVGLDQIPRPADVSDVEKCLTLEPRKGERAMLIKNAGGDWGVLIGRWDGFRKGVPARKGITRNSPGSSAVPGDPGYLTLLFYKIKTMAWQMVSLEDCYRAEDFRFKIADSDIDMKRGHISINPRHESVAENLALAFSVSLLHVLLQPRPATWEPGQSLEPSEAQRRGARNIRFLKTNGVALFVAAGLLMGTPSNHHIHHKVKKGMLFGIAGRIARGHSHDGDDDDRGAGVNEDRQEEGQPPWGGGHGNEDNDGRDVINHLLGDDDEDEVEAEADVNTNYTDGMYDGRDEEGGMDDIRMDLADDGHHLDDQGGFSDMDRDTLAMYENEVLGEDFNTYLGDLNTGGTYVTTSDNIFADDVGIGGGGSGGGEGGGGGFSLGYHYDDGDGEGGGCGGCGGGGFGDGGLGGIGDGGGGGDSSGGGGGLFGGGFSGGAFSDGGALGGGDSGGGGGAFGGGIDSGGGGWGDGGDGGGGGWGDGGGGGNGGGGGGDGGGGGGDGGGCGGCGG